MKIALIGGSGFIGTRLADIFTASDRDFTVFDKNISEKYPDKTVIADIRNKESLTEKLSGYDMLINLAAEHKDNVLPVDLYQQVNVEGSENVCHAAECNNIEKIIFTSSVAIYGNTEKETDETGERNYFNEYGRTKNEAEKVYEKWLKRSSGRTLFVVRPSVVFGEGNRGNVYNLLRQIASGKFLMVGDGTNIKSMAYVENVASFIDYLVDYKAASGVFNYVDKPDFDMNSLVDAVYSQLGKKGNRMHFPVWLGLAGGAFFDLLSRLTGKEFPVSMIRVKKFCSSSHFSSGTIAETGFVPPVAIREAISKTIQNEFCR